MSQNAKEVQKKADDKRAGKRARAWTALVYEDSAKPGWQEILADELVECLISPLHDKDVLEDGTPKKAHWHVVLSYKNPVGREKAAEVFERIGAVMAPERDVNGRDKSKVGDFRQMARYLCHLDQPEKHRYNIADVKSIGAIDYQTLILTAQDEDAILDEIEEFIEMYRIVSFASFQRYVRNCRPEWKYFVRHKFSYYIRETIKANMWDVMNEDFVARTELWEGDAPIYDNENSTYDNEICCPECGSKRLVKNGKTQAGSQVWKCKDCGKRFA